MWRRITRHFSLSLGFGALEAKFWQACGHRLTGQEFPLSLAVANSGCSSEITPSFNFQEKRKSLPKARPIYAFFAGAEKATFLPSLARLI